MAYDETLAERVREVLPDAGLSEKKMFGGLCFLMMLRVGPGAYESALARPHAREMDFTGRALKGMIYVDAAGIATEEDLADWIGLAVAFASSLPHK